MPVGRSRGVVGRVHHTSMRRIAAAAVLVALLGACSQSSWTPKPQAPVTQAVLAASLRTTGALTASDSYTITTGPNGVASCRLAALSGDSALRQFVIRGPGTLAAPVYFLFRTVAYRGPGTYRQPDDVRPESIAAVISRASVDFYPAPGSRVTMSINPDASGHASFTSFVSNDGRTLSGTVRWICKTQGAL